ncbi:MAG: hypothetical protein M3Y17_08160, partial [Actinomycetota bacterium]|nr:hypothetical protein [Actinomycetota bacterium]
GFVGLIVAVPILGTVKVLVEELWLRSIESGTDPVAGEAGTDESDTDPGESDKAPLDGDGMPLEDDKRPLHGDTTPVASE